MAAYNLITFAQQLDERWKTFLDENGLTPALRAVDPLAGQRLRPRALFYSAQAAGAEGDRLIDAALAIQCIHMASLLHDDILDDSPVRRGVGSLSSKHRLLLGDLLITSAYKLAAPLGIAAEAFAEAVHRMARGEAGQGAASGQLDFEAYRRILLDKSGALFGWSLAAPWLLAERVSEAKQVQALGDRLGYLYQLVDDFLDWCPFTNTGKPPLQDGRQGKKTLPAFEFRGELRGDVEEQLHALYADGAMARAARRIEHERFHWLHDARPLLGGAWQHFETLTGQFTVRVEKAYEENEHRLLQREERYA